MRRIDEMQAGMPLQFIDTLRTAMLGKIARRCVQTQTGFSEFPGNIGRMQVVGDANSQIEAAVIQVDGAVLQGHAYRNLRILPLIGIDGRHHVHAAEIDRRTDFQQSLDGTAQFQSLFLQLQNIFEYLLAALIILAAGFRQTDFPRSAVEQADPQFLFQIGDIFADHHRGNVPLSGYCGQGTQFHHAAENRHAVEFIHIKFFCNYSA